MDAASSGRLREALRAARLTAFLGSSPPTRLVESETGSDGELDRLIAQAAAVYRRSVTEETRATYARRWRFFAQWCDAKALAALPCEPETLMLYLSDAASKSGGPAALGTLRSWVAAINRVHVEAGYSPPGADPAMRVFLNGLSKKTAHPAAPVMSALRIAELRRLCRMLDAIETNRVEVRDRAILALHRERLGDGEIARLRWSDLILTPRSLTMRIDDPRTGRPRRVVAVSTTADDHQRTREAVAAWRSTVGDTTGRVFCCVDGAGKRVVDGPLTPGTVWDIRHARLRSLGREGDNPTQVLDRAIALLGHRPLDVVRDKAILLLGFAGAFRRVDVTRLRWDDVKDADGGLVVHLRRSKTDQMGRGVDVGIPYGRSALTCPVGAMAAWRARCEEQLGTEAVPSLPCFIRIGRAGRIDTTPLTPEALTRMVSRRAQQAELPGRWGGRSLRAGFISTAADLDIPLERIAQQSRHATLDTLVLYIRNDDPFRRNPASNVGL